MRMLYTATLKYIYTIGDQPSNLRSYINDIDMNVVVRGVLYALAKSMRDGKLNQHAQHVQHQTIISLIEGAGYP